MSGAPLIKGVPTNAQYIILKGKLLPSFHCNYLFKRAPKHSQAQTSSFKAIAYKNIENPLRTATVKLRSMVDFFSLPELLGTHPQQQQPPSVFKPYTSRRGKDNGKCVTGDREEGAESPRC
ncbi:hypothetical protein CEXT_668131 [Caerostris extrusa]|uniref:Uncharacterized protein n=1 Tax=Caerostris extrusa TaxID=172846 RepID=A0AAV4VY21_CAEEX|nr:hypothetical protein CEXT_668131 [Caerostris extrusa]